MDQQSLLPSFLRDSDLLVDTNFFIDSFSNPKNFAQFISALKENGVEIVSTPFVKYEFIRSRTIDVVRRKESFFNELVGTILPFDLSVDKEIVGLIEEYKQYMEGVSVVDLILGCFLKKHKNKLYVLTRDHKDFPTTIFDRVFSININGVRDVKTYSFYAYGTLGKENKKSFSNDDIPF